MDQRQAGNNEEYRLLLGRIAGGNESALEAFYKAFEPKIFAFAKIRLNDFHESADLLNEVMLEVWRNAGRFEGRSSVTTWVFGIAHHKVMDRLRKKGKQQWESLESADSIESDENLEEILTQTQVGEHIHWCMEKLSDEQRQVVHLAFFEDLSYREVGTIMGSPEGTIKARMFHAKKALKRCLSRRMK